MQRWNGIVLLSILVLIGVALGAAVPHSDRCELQVATVALNVSNNAIHPAVLCRAKTLNRPVAPEILHRASRLRQIIESGPNPSGPPIFCFDPSTPDVDMSILYDLVPELNPALRYQFGDSSRWGGGGQQGNPTILSWSFVPDGLSVDGGTSTLFSSMDAKFGSRALWISRVQACFDRWAALTGTSYVRVTAPGVDWDDGAAWFTNGDDVNRGDVRISSIIIDGGSNVLAYNYFPETGDMVLDSSESWGVFSTNNHRFFRNVIMHEHGHGLGFNHQCPIYETALMEPFLSTMFDGPQHDDIRAGQRGYGDANETNDSSAAATNIGSVIFGSPVTYGATPAPVITNGSILSIDAEVDHDWYRFSVIAESTASITVSPVGLNYDSSPQNCSGQFGSCCSFNFTDSSIIYDLAFDLVDSDGTTIIATANSQPVGTDETLTDIPLPNSPGDYYIHVYPLDANNKSQLYTIDISVVTVGADISSPQPDPIGFEQPPLPDSTTAITMIANEASDATAPITYQFDFVSGGSGGTDSLFQASRTYTDVGLLPNRNYTYRVRTRDSAPAPGPNTGAYSANVIGTTHIETPAGVAIGTVTDTTVQMSATGIISFYDSGQSGLFFDSVTPGGNTGINEWIQVNSDTATNLVPNTEYELRAKARNRNAIETVDFSPSSFAVTLAAIPGAPALTSPTSSTMYIDPDSVNNSAATEMVIQCTATSPLDANWDGQFASASGTPSASEVWQDDATWGNLLLTGMQPETQYTFAVKARNQSLIETAFGPSASLSTTSTSFCALLGDVNNSTILDGEDIAGFVRVKLGVPDPGDMVPCADYGNGDVALDTAEFVDDLLDE